MIRTLSLALVCLLPLPASADAPFATTGAGMNCAPLAGPADSEQTRLAARLAAGSPQAGSLLEWLAAKEVTLCFASAAWDARGFFDPEANQIVIEARLAPGQQLAILAHELRHADQVARGYCPTVRIRREDAIMMTLAMEADAQALATLVAWQLQESGDAEAWSALLTDPLYGDITARFAGARAKGASEAEAVSAAFDQWFASDVRRARYYAAGCERYLATLEREHLTERYEALPDSAFNEFCVLPDASRYECEVFGRPVR